MSNSTQNTEHRPRRGSNTDMKCPKCEQVVVSRRDNPIQCKLCDSTWHKECVENMDDDTYRVLKKNEKKTTPSLYWYCSKQCDKAAVKFLGGMTHLETQIKATNSKVAELEKTVNDVNKGNFPAQMVDKVREIANEVIDDRGAGNINMTDAATHVSTVQEIIEQEKKEQIAEIEDRMRRKCNLVIFKMPETELAAEGSDGAQDISPKEQDKQLIETILEEIGAKPVPNDVRRLGKYKKENMAKSRPIRLSFNSEKERDEVLSLAYRSNKNRKVDDAKLCNKVTWRKDLTVQEREDENRLYEELKTRRQASKDSGDDKARWVRRRGLLVNLGDYSTPEETINTQGDKNKEGEEGAVQTEWN